MKLYLYAAAAIALAAFAFYVHHLQTKAARVDVAERALADYDAAVKARDEKEAKDREAAALRSATLSSTLETVSTKLNELRANPPKQAVKYVQLPGEECPRLRLDPEWVSAYNAASEASAVPDPH